MSSADAEEEPQRTPPAMVASSSTMPRSSATRKRARSGSSSGVRFHSVNVRTFGMEVWGGGGVPADDGPPLGLGWDIKGEQSTPIDEYEDERAHEGRTPKDSYCMEGCVEPDQRRRMLLSSGSTMKQIKAAQKAVAQLNQDRWKASELLFGDAWLFRAPRHTDTVEVLAMLGQPDTRGAELSVANWDCPEACARELAVPLRCSPAMLLSSSDTESGEDGASDEGSSLEEGVLWTRVSTAMQALTENVVLVIRCDDPRDPAASGSRAATGMGLALLGRLVGCVAHAHIAAQVMHSMRGKVSIVLRGWADDKIEADWSDEESDEFCISPLS